MKSLGPNDVTLRRISLSDLPQLFKIQADPLSNQLAATIPRTEAAFEENWINVLATADIVTKAIICQDMLVGHVTCFPVEGAKYIGY